MIKSFHELEVWKRAHAMVLDVYRITNEFPRSEQFGVVSQLRRAAYSIPANIAECYGRKSAKELLQCLAVPKTEKDLKAIAEMIEGLARSLRRRLSLGLASSAPSSRNTGHGTRITRPSTGVAH